MCPITETMGRVGGGSLTLRGQGSLANLFELSLVGRRWQAFDFNAETKVTFDPSNYMQMAGLTNFYNHLCWSWAFITWDEKRGQRVIEVAQNDFDTYTSFLKTQPSPFLMTSNPYGCEPKCVLVPTPTSIRSMARHGMRFR